MKKIKPPKERFLKFFKKHNNSSCWVWTGGTTSDGYGKFWLNKTMKAHKVSYLLYKGVIPGGFCVLHICDNPKCVNPKHLWLDTQLDNIKDRESKGRGGDHKNISNKTRKRMSDAQKRRNKLIKDKKYGK